ncbi:MAG TPA: glycosyltransferase family 9 protein [Ignavibacteriaceae bacterium]|nr:glycosyltransferase family 9 protein [Ignavibacteriaceae bacterium]
MQKILVIQTAFLGDAILTLPMIQVLKQNNPESKVDVICIPGTKIIFENSPYVNEALVMDKRGLHKKFPGFIQFARMIKKRNYNIVYAPHRSFRTSMLVYLSNIAESYGFNINSFKHFYKYLIDYNPTAHEVQRSLDLIGYKYDYESWKILPELKSNSKDVDDFVSSINSNKIAAVAPGSVWNTKKYPIEYYKEIIEYLIQNDFYVLVLGGKEDKAECEALASNFEKNILSIAGKFNIIESIELLKNCNILICNDSAPTHMGMCANIPVITLYCSTVADFGFYPYNKRSVYLSFDDLKCKPCGIHGYDVCPIGTFECGKGLLPNTVINKIKEIINNV